MTPLRQSIYSALERGIVGGYAVVLCEIVRRRAEMPWGDEVHLAVSVLAGVLVAAIPPAKFPMMILAGGHLILAAAVGEYTNIAWDMLEAGPGQHGAIWARGFSHGALPLCVILVARENGPYGSAFIERRKRAKATPGHHHLSAGQKLILLLSGLAAMTLVYMWGPGGQLFLSVYFLAPLLGVAFVAMVLRAIRSALHPPPELPVAARRISVHERIREQPKIRHHWTIGGD
ncbi:hypothetical protein ABI59_15465 [Acidobacteria bacterium Mor1]|nr:hypothetical protein ABI59_15465 [Acidobacteria bacterium Mor1]